MCSIGIFACKNKGLTFKTLSVDGTKISGVVSNATTEFSFIDEIELHGAVSYIVDNDKDCGSPIPSKTVDLEIGDNVFYVLESIGNEVKLYTVTIRRRPMYKVTFDVDGGTAVEQQVIEENCFATEPKTTRKGYTFVGWDYDFATPITANTKIVAKWEESSNILNFNGNGATSGSMSSVTIKTGATYTLKANTFIRAGYEFIGWANSPDDEMLYADKAVYTMGMDSEYTLYAKWDKATEGLEYSFSDSSCSVIGYVGTDTSVFIPSKYNGYPVTSIGYEAFSDCSDVTSIAIPNRATLPSLHPQNNYCTL